MTRRITVVRRVSVRPRRAARGPRPAPDPLGVGAPPASRRRALTSAVRRLLRASGSVAAQLSQALASLLFGVLGLRVLSAADFGVLGLLLGGTVVATAVMTGFVGDSLTVLDRSEPRVRAALLQCGAGLSVLLLVAAAVTTWTLGLLGLGSALLFGAAVAAFVLEDTGRRLLMATLRFWPVVVVDLVHLSVAGAVLLLRSLRGTGGLQLEDFLLALLVGQLVALGTSVLLLPPDERRLPATADADLRAVAAFGSWRALLQAVRPAALTLVRSIVLVGSGAVALAAFEAGRLYVAPALLMVQGAGGYLLAHQAVERRRSTADALRSADRTAALLALMGLSAGAVLVLLLPWLGPVLTGGTVAISALNVLAWASVAAAGGLSVPYGTLASVRSRPHRVLIVRLIDTAVVLSVVGLMVLLPVRSTPWLPTAVAVGSLTSAALQRRLVARGAARPGSDEDRAPAAPAATTS